MLRPLLVSIGSLAGIALVVFLGLYAYRTIDFTRGPDPVETLQSEVAALRVTLETVTKSSKAANIERDRIEKSIAALASQSELAALKEQLDTLRSEVAVLSGKPIITPPPDAPTINDVSGRLDALQNRLTEIFSQVTNLSDAHNGLRQDTQQIASFDDRLRGLELQMQVIADDIAIVSGRVDQLVTNGSSPAIASTPSLCPARSVDGIISAVGSERLDEMLASCRGQGGRAVNLRILRRDTACDALNEREACLSIERVWLQQQ